MERAARCLENGGLDPELNEQLKLAAEEMMRELHEECDHKVRANTGLSIEHAYLFTKLVAIITRLV